MNLLNFNVDEKKRIQIYPFSKAIERLTEMLDESLPICVIGCSGQVGIGKSTLMNLFALHIDPSINSKDLFKSGESLHSTTEGCRIFLAKKLIYRGVQIILMDFEGFGGIKQDDSNINQREYQLFLQKILFFNFMVSSAMTICCNLRINQVEVNFYQELEKQYQINQKENLNHPHLVNVFLKDGYRMIKSTDQENQKYQEEFKKKLSEYCPTFFNKVDIIKMPRINDEVLDFKEKIQLEEINNFLKSIKLDKLPKKKEFLILLNDILSIINEEQNEKFLAQQQRSYKAFEYFIPHFEELNQKTELLVEKCLKCYQNEENFVVAFMCYEREFMELFTEVLAKQRIYLPPIVQRNKEQMRNLFNSKLAKKYYSLRLKGIKENNKTILENIIHDTVNNFWNVIENYFQTLVKLNLPTLELISQKKIDD